jgi:hypothetical protein
MGQKRSYFRQAPEALPRIAWVRTIPSVACICSLVSAATSQTLIPAQWVSSAKRSRSANLRAATTARARLSFCSDTIFAWGIVQILRLMPKAYFLRIRRSNRKWLAAGRALARCAAGKSHENHLENAFYTKSFYAHKNRKQRR